MRNSFLLTATLGAGCTHVQPEVVHEVQAWAEAFPSALPPLEKAEFRKGILEAIHDLEFGQLQVGSTVAGEESEGHSYSEIIESDAQERAARDIEDLLNQGVQPLIAAVLHGDRDTTGPEYHPSAPLLGFSVLDAGGQAVKRFYVVADFYTPSSGPFTQCLLENVRWPENTGPQPGTFMALSCRDNDKLGQWMVFVDFEGQEDALIEHRFLLGDNTWLQGEIDRTNLTGYSFVMAGFCAKTADALQGLTLASSTARLPNGAARTTIFADASFSEMPGGRQGTYTSREYLSGELLREELTELAAALPQKGKRQSKISEGVTSMGGSVSE